LSEDRSMNILIIGKFYTEGFALHIAEALTAMGHTVRRFEPGFRSGRIAGRAALRLDQVRAVIYNATDGVPAIRASRMQRLWRMTKQGSLEVVIVGHDFLWPAEVEELKRRTGAKVAMWFPDHLGNFGRGYFMKAPYDSLFFKDPYIVHVLGDILKSPVYYLPECFNPERHCVPDGEIGHDPIYQCDITTAGNQHSWRVAFMEHLAGRNVKLWGNQSPLWLASGSVAHMYQGRRVSNHNKARAFLGAKIVLNNLHYGEVWGVNARTFEAAGIGAFQLVDWRPGLRQLFEDGKEIVSFSGMEDLGNKIDYYLIHEEERCAIARAGKVRAHRDHTYIKRLLLLLDTLAGKMKGYPLPDIQYSVK
jgi:spore maturation protein CgeB